MGKGRGDGAEARAGVTGRCCAGEAGFGGGVKVSSDERSRSASGSGVGSGSGLLLCDHKRSSREGVRAHLEKALRASPSTPRSPRSSPVHPPCRSSSVDPQATRHYSTLARDPGGAKGTLRHRHFFRQLRADLWFILLGLSAHFPHRRLFRPSGADLWFSLHGLCPMPCIIFDNFLRRLNGWGDLSLVW